MGMEGGEGGDEDNEEKRRRRRVGFIYNIKMHLVRKSRRLCVREGRREGGRPKERDKNYSYLLN